MIDRAALACVLIAIAGCGDNVLPAEPVPLSAFSEAARDAICDWSVRCQHVPDRQTCDRLLDPKDYDARRVQDSVAARRLAYDPLDAGVCFESTRSAHCLVAPFSNRACDSMFAGTVREGGACTASFECAGGAECRSPVCEGQCCAGVCGPPIPPDPTVTLSRIGESCASHFDCVTEAYCENGGLCTATPAKEGARCLFGCARGDLFCDLDTLTCKAFAGEGQPCDPDGQTAPPCDAAWALCDQVCVPRPGAGDACDDADRRCVPATRCEGGICEPRAAIGQACEDSDQCDVACVDDACVDYETCSL